MIGLAAFMFITSGMFKDALECLLSKGDYADNYAGNYVRRVKKRLKDGGIDKMTRIIGVASAFFWPLVVAGYLLWSFIADAWHISWILWPICGLVFGAFAGAVGAYYSLGGGEKK
jgi:hypothetical protein